MPQKTAQVSYFTVTADETGQRLDNYLLARLKGVPRSLIYRIIRSGEVRVNKGRAKAAQRLESGDAVRVPPVRMAEPGQAPRIPESLRQDLAGRVLYRDNDILALNKPAGLAVHAGSGLSFGLIDVARALWGEDWQLVHRLDRETGGCLLLVRRRELQREFQQRLSEGSVSKRYQAVVHGLWPHRQSRIESWVGRQTDSGGQRRVRGQEEGEGQRAVSHFEPERALREATLMRVRIETGRTHQIRVQAAEAGHPLVGDEKYGRRELDRGLGLRKPPLCLHAEALELELGGRELCLKASVSPAMAAVIAGLEHGA